MPIRTSEATWQGDLPKGKGSIKVGAGAFEGSYSFESRFEQGQGTNPEELLAAAHAGCFSMALSHLLAQAGHPAESVHTTAKVRLDKAGDGFAVTHIALETRGRVPGVDEATFKKHAEEAKTGCPISKALQSVDMSVTARLE